MTRIKKAEKLKEACERVQDTASMIAHGLMEMKILSQVPSMDQKSFKELMREKFNTLDMLMKSLGSEYVVCKELIFPKPSKSH